MKQSAADADVNGCSVANCVDVPIKQRDDVSWTNSLKPFVMGEVYKNSSGDEIAKVNFLTTISHTRRPTSKYRKRDKPTSFNKLDDR